MHQVIMLDELTTARRIRWDDSTDKFQGSCQEHNHKVSLTFSSERELDLLCDALQKNEVHLASEVCLIMQRGSHTLFNNFHLIQATVAALGVISENPREYSARPIMFSGTCKKETGEEHAHLIRTILKATENHKNRNGITYRIVCVASDGEAKRGDALVILTMHSTLSSDSPIYKHLKPLVFMNLLVGQDDITADKDFKHVFKRQRNLMMRNKGIVIQGFCITPPILRLHLESNGVPPYHLRALLNPNDQQDVVLGYSLLKEIWSLPPAPQNSSPSFTRARDALHLYGQFAHHLITPYILCIHLNLDEQLIHLSTAAHLALYLYHDNSACTKFMPSQSYIDIMLMIKNVYFCIAKAKIDNPSGKFYIILLGTDRIEIFFGFIRTAVGTDTNVDMIQLGSRASGLTKVAIILAEHPEWDHSPQRLHLPAITKDSGDISSKVDHINPASWRGNVKVTNVNLQTCWLLGHRKAVELIPEADAVFDQLSQVQGVDILSPFGQILVNQRDLEDEYDYSELATGYTTLETPILSPPEHLTTEASVIHTRRRFGRRNG